MPGQAPQTTKATTATKVPKGAVSAFDPHGLLDAIHPPLSGEKESWAASNIGRTSGSSEEPSSEYLRKQLGTVSISNAANHAHIKALTSSTESAEEIKVQEYATLSPKRMKSDPDILVDRTSTVKKRQERDRKD